MFYQRSFTVSCYVYDAMLRRLFFNACVFSCVRSMRMAFKFFEIVYTLSIDGCSVFVDDCLGV
ncbi:hypothetical protein Hanom_Chr09g00820881 [Helianthus anomalus]